MNYKNTNDYELMYLVSENMEDAVNTLYQKYRPVINNFAYKYYKLVEGCGLELEDFIQEGYIGLDRAIKNYTQEKNCLFYTFATLCIERQLQTVVRNSKTRKQEILNNAVSFDYELPYTDMTVGDVVVDELYNDPLVDLLDREYEKELTNFRHELSVLQSEVFQLRCLGFKYEEIANLLGISKKSVDSHLGRVRKKLRERGFDECNI